MQEKQRLRDTRQERSVSEAEAQLADRLDRLSAPLAEQVMRRAIDLHHDEEFAEDTSVSFDELAALAAELGIGAKTVRRALLEQLDTEHEPKTALFQSLFGPSRLSGGIVAEGDAEAVADQIDEWMRDIEGMHPLRQNGRTVTWESVRGDGRLVSTLKSMGADGVAQMRQTELSDGDQLVEIDLDASAVRKGAMLMFALGVFMGLCAAMGFAFNETFANFFVRFFVPLGIGSGIGVASAIATAKYYGNKLKKQINRTLDGIVHLTTFKRRKRRDRPSHGPTPNWSEIVDEIYE